LLSDLASLLPLQNDTVFMIFKIESQLNISTTVMRRRFAWTAQGQQRSQIPLLSSIFHVQISERVAIDHKPFTLE